MQINALFDEIFNQKIYYFETRNTEPFIIDCGSNIGMSVIFFKKLYPKAKILAFEPASVNFETLNKNIKENNLNNVTTIKKALSNKKGIATLYNPGWEGGTLLKISNATAGEDVETTILSEYVNQEVDLLKIDIEGGETDVIEELANKNKLFLIKELILEYHHTLNNPSLINPSSNSIVKILKMLEKNKFKYLFAFDADNTYNSYTDHKKNSQTFLLYAYRQN